MPARSFTEPPVDPPITIRYVTGAPIRTPKPSLPPTMSPMSLSPLTTSVSAPEVATMPANQNSDFSSGTSGSDQADNESTEVIVQMAEDADDSSGISSINQLMGQEGSSAMGIGKGACQGGGVAFALLCAMSWLLL